MDTRARLVERTIETGITLRNAIAEFYRDETGPLTTAWCESIDALRAIDAAAKPLPFGCVVREKQNDLWQVENADGTRWWSSVTRRWSDILVCHGFATTEAHAISDFHATNKGVAPPGWVEPKDAADLCRYRYDSLASRVAEVERQLGDMKSDLYKFAADTVRNSAMVKNVSDYVFTPTPPATASDKPRYEIVTNYAQAHWAIRRLADGEYWMNGVPSWTSFSSTATWFNSRPIAAAVARVLEEQP